MHKDASPYRLLRLVTFVLLALLPFHTETSARDYTEDHPLRYVDSWDLWPFSYLDDNGNPTGFNIDLIRALMKRLDIPYEIQLKHSSNAYEDLQKGESDLIMGMHAPFHDTYGKYGHNVVVLFTHSIVSSKRNPTKISKFSELNSASIMVHENSFSHHMMQDSGIANRVTPYDDMKEAVLMVNSNDTMQVLWNTMSLKWLVNNYKLEDVVITPVAMPHGEYRFMSNDSLLLARLDSAYTEMVINEEIQPLRNKWFYPEYRDTGIPSYVWTILWVIVIVIAITLVTSVMYRRKEKQVTHALNNQNRQLQLYLNSGKVELWTYEVATRKIQRITTSENSHANSVFGLPVNYTSEDFNRITSAINSIKQGDRKNASLVVKGYTDKQNTNLHYYNLSLSVLQQTQGVPSLILGTQVDVTKQYLLEQANKERLLQYYTLFDSAMMDMAYLDKDGYLVNLNDQACKTLGIKDKSGLKKARLHVSGIIPLQGITPNSKEIQWTSSFNNLDEERGNGKVKFIGRSGTLYYESISLPILDKDGNLDCTYIVGRDITSLVENIHEEQERSRHIHEATRRIQNYIDNINYVLEESDINIANYYLDSKNLKITRNLHMPKLILPQLKCLRMTDMKDWRRLINAFERMDRQQAGSISLLLKTIFDDEEGRPLHMSFDAVPVYSEKGKIDHYFGLCRNVSELVETERLLEIETKKAQEAETLKNAFLRNMSHEIRTPLNAVIGFAELFDTDHDPEDEAIFVEEIKKNTDILLKLVNDILLLSRLDANMIEFKNQPTDMINTIEAHCNIGWSKYLNNDTQVQFDHTYDKLVVNTDRENLARIIEHIAGNAAHYTKQGYIRVKYSYHGGNLIVSIEDTGVGMSEEQLKHLFDRFSDANAENRQSTGLGMHICKEMITQMGGTIDVDSEPGRGTTVWINLPCELIELKKSNISNSEV